MKKLLFVLCAGFSLSAYGQASLPYFCDFSDPAQNGAWQQFRTGSLETPIYKWGIGGAEAILFHDYPVGASSTDTTKDWFVSPAFDFSSGAKLAFKFSIAAFGGHSVPEDKIGVYLLVGSPDPDIAVITPLVDLTHYVSTNTSFQDTSGVILPPTSGDAYIAFYYQATNNWITAGIDSVSILSEGVGVNDGILHHKKAVAIYPNPANDRLFIRLPANTSAPVDIAIFDIYGRSIFGLSEQPLSQDAVIVDISALSPGMYFVQLTNDNGINEKRKFIKE